MQRAMPADRHERRKMRQDDGVVLNRLENEAETIKASRVREVVDRYDNLKAEIKRLQDEKHELYCAPPTKKEFLESAKIELASLQQDALDRGLRPGIEGCYNKNMRVFPEPGTKLHLINEQILWKMLLLAVRPQDLERIMEAIPEGGVSQDERQRRAEEIDKHIKELSQRLSVEFAGQEQLERLTNVEREILSLSRSLNIEIEPDRITDIGGRIEEACRVLLTDFNELQVGEDKKTAMKREIDELFAALALKFQRPSIQPEQD